MGGCRPTLIGWATLVLLLFVAGGVVAYQRQQGSASFPPPLLPGLPGTAGQAPAAPPAPPGTACASYLPLPYAASQGLAAGVALQARGIGLDAEDLEEAERYARLKRGDYILLPATHASCALFCDDDTVVLFVVDESAGADEIWV